IRLTSVTYSARDEEHNATAYSNIVSLKLILPVGSAVFFVFLLVLRL
ncbi:MAG: hypothetical protein ACI90V_009157, partial [Bacillariaceae sp.]